MHNNHEILVITPSSAVLHWPTLQFMAAVANSFCTIVAMHVLATVMGSISYSIYTWADFQHAHPQLSHVYLDVHP